MVAAAPPDPSRVESEGSSLYGLNYFDDHAREMGHPSLAERARLDLPERCAFWLETLLRFRPPPARSLELGCANGAFVGLLAEAGYEATGLDLSPAVTTLVRDRFAVPVLTGPVEEQHLPSASFDVVVMMDVLEHLADPLATLGAVADVLAPGGLVLVQTPRLDPSRSFEELVASGDPFLAHLKPREHLFLLGEAAARALLEAAGFPVLRLVPAIFHQYDMSFVASRAPLPELPEAEGRAALRRTRSGRVVEALLDAAARLRDELPTLSGRVAALEAELASLRAELAGVRDALAGVERSRTETLARLGAVSHDLDAMARELARLRAVEEEHDLVVRRLGVFAGIFQRRQPRT